MGYLIFGYLCVSIFSSSSEHSPFCNSEDPSKAKPENVLVREILFVLAFVMGKRLKIIKEKKERERRFFFPHKSFCYSVL